MGTSGYDIRHAILCQAKDMLYESWHMASDFERTAAERENRAPKPIASPTVSDIKAVAEQLYEFVLRKG